MTTTLSTGATSVPKRPDVGFRFHPTDKELLNYYLRLKNLGVDYKVRAINVVNVCKFEPWDLPDQSYIRSNEEIWYFFCPRDFKYAKSKRFNRTTEEGYWKPTGKPRPITSVKKQIGSKKTLVFHRGRPKGRRTDWVIHEYDFCASSNLQGNFVLCRLKRKTQKIGQDQAVYYETVENEHQNEVTAMLTDEGGHNSFTASQDSREQILTCASTPLILLGDGVSAPMALSNLESTLKPLDFENQTPVPPPDLENQMSLYRQSFPTPSGLENLSSIAPFNIENTSTPSNENQTLMTHFNIGNLMSFTGTSFSPVMAPSNLENGLWFCGEAISPATTVSNLESYIPVSGESTCPTIVPHYSENLSSYLKDDSISITDFENCPCPSTSGEGQRSPLASPFNSYEKGDCVFTSNVHNQNLAYGEDGLSPVANPITFRYESPDEKSDCLYISDLEIPTPNFDSEVGEMSPVLVGSSDSNNQPISVDNTSSCRLNPPVADPSSFHESELVADDFGKLNSEEKADISVTQDGLPSSLNTNETSSPEEDYWSLLMSLDLESGKGQATITEVEVNLVTAPECNFGSENVRPTFGELSPWGLWVS